VTGGEPPGALAVRVAILAANGYEEGAPERCAPPQRETAFARGTRSDRSAFAIKLQATSHECHSERSEESLVISGTDLISTARDVSLLLNMTARFQPSDFHFFS
jgi:hypothetical protein